MRAFSIIHPWVHRASLPLAYGQHQDASLGHHPALLNEVRFG